VDYLPWKEIQARLYNETKNLSPEELVLYYQKKAKFGPFKKRRTA
jgi:hypothetical protein